MFIIIFLIALFLFLTQVKFLDFGLLGKVYYIGNWVDDNAVRIPVELYKTFIFVLVCLGILAVKNIIDHMKVEDIKTNNHNHEQKEAQKYHENVKTNDNNLIFDKDNLTLEKLIEIRAKDLITDEEFKRIKKKL
ncbi:MAG: SHOCT domain-containing protein [Candidatus Izemoplasmatales bacterium]